ncbi:OmpA family protein [Vibrio sp.]|uniref:OmpA family protein n=1 Tax=Vibrio sp. TaxID=678 RepID=UPI003D0DEA6E
MVQTIKPIAITSLLLVLAGCSSKPDVTYRPKLTCSVFDKQQVVERCGADAYLAVREQELRKASEQAGFNIDLQSLYTIRDPENPNKTIPSNQEVSNANYAGQQLVILPDQPLFKSGSGDIADQDARDKLTRFFKSYLDTLDTQTQIVVVGHTDAVGDKQSNQKLSELRAKTIADIMFDLTLEGTTIYSVQYRGMGESNPIAPNNTVKGRNTNRRVEIIEIHNPEADLYTRYKVMDIRDAVSTSNPAYFTLTLPKPARKTTRRKVVDRNPLKLHGELTDGQTSGAALTARLGEKADTSVFSFFRKAVASPVTDSCVNLPAPTKSNIVGKRIAHAQSIPLLYGTHWVSRADGKNTLIVLGPVQIRAEDLMATVEPEMSFWLDYRDPNSEPSYQYPMLVQTEGGDDKVLYRLYPKEDNAHLVCADLIFSTTGDNKTDFAELYYRSGDALYRKEFQLTFR